MSLEPCPKCGELNSEIAKLARQASLAHAKGRSTEKFREKIAKLKQDRENCTREGHYSAMVNAREGSSKRHEYDRQRKAGVRE